MKKKAVLLAEVLLAAVMVFAAAAVGGKLLDYRKGAQEYDAAEQIAFAGEAPAEESADEFEKELEGIDLSALREINSEVVGWIAIPGTEVSYPVMQGKDNAYYLNHTWNGAASSVGAIFLEYRNRPDFEGFHSILYGHQMRNGSMFGGLHQYADEAYLRGHPTIYLVTDGGVQQYDIFAAYEVGVNEIVYTLDIEKNERRQELIDLGLSRSAADAGVTPTTDGHILTLSTCTGRGYATRWVVQGVRREKGPQE